MSEVGVFAIPPNLPPQRPGFKRLSADFNGHKKTRKSLNYAGF
jgi:hypothetical protein